MNRPSLVIRLEQVAWGIGVSTAIVVCGHVATQVARFAFGRATLLGITPRLYLGSEASLPAWFSSALLLLCGLVLWAISALASQARAPHVRSWRLLAALFVALSLDEAAAFHELLSAVISAAMGSVGVLTVFRGAASRYAWVLAGTLFSVIVAVSSIRFLRDLPTRTALFFVASGAAYVGGAIGVESVSGWYSGTHGADNPTFVAILTAEEVLEMVGAGVFLHSLIAYLGEQYGAFLVLTPPWSGHGDN